MKLKDEIMQIPKRKKLTEPSRYVMRYYSRLKSNRMNTEPVQNNY